MEIGSQAVQRLYGDALKAAQPGQLDAQTSFDERNVPTFSETIVDAASDTVETIVSGERMAIQSMTGKADPHSVVEALAATEMAIEMAVTVRDKVVEAYQEILRMPV